MLVISVLLISCQNPNMSMEMIESLNFRQVTEAVKVKYAYIKMQEDSKKVTSTAQQNVQDNEQLHVQDNNDWVYLVVSPWTEEQFIKVPTSPARYCVKGQDETADCSK